jgi:hypothetical protein
MVYDLSPDSGTERLVTFLDLCSSIKAIPLHALDPAADEVKGGRSYPRGDLLSERVW